jgi:predicted nucleic-acid-binding Zn-ribbon protein
MLIKFKNYKIKCPKCNSENLEKVDERSNLVLRCKDCMWMHFWDDLIFEKIEDEK